MFGLVSFYLEYKLKTKIRKPNHSNECSLEVRELYNIVKTKFHNFKWFKIVKIIITKKVSNLLAELSAKLKMF